MSVTLEELLERSGINSLRGEEQEKTASDNAQNEDLVSALREMAEEQPTSEYTKKLAAQELAEKTAEIAVIAQTLSEIEKVASPGAAQAPNGHHQKLATFIKVALDSGHSETEIAAFLKKAGRIGRAIKSGIQAMRRPYQRAAKGVYESVADAETRLLREKLISGSQKEVEKHINMLKAQHGKDVVVKKLMAMKDDLGHLPYPAMRELPKGSGKTVGLRLGGSELALPAEQALTAAKIGGGVAGGALLGHAATKKKDGGGGVTVVRN